MSGPEARRPSVYGLNTRCFLRVHRVEVISVLVLLSSCCECIG